MLRLMSRLLHHLLLLRALLRSMLVLPLSLLSPSTEVVEIKPSASVACFVACFGFCALCVWIELLPKLLCFVDCLCWSSPGCFQDHCSATM